MREDRLVLHTVVVQLLKRGHESLREAFPDDEIEIDWVSTCRARISLKSKDGNTRYLNVRISKES